MGQHQAGTQEKITTLTSATGLTASVYWGTSFGESLTNGILTSGTGWTPNADMAAAGNAATYTHSTGAGTLTQAAGSLALTGRSGKVYDFTYTVSSPSGAAPTIVIDDDFAIVDTALIGLDTAGTYTVRFKTATTPGDFILSGTSTATGAVTLDALSLKEVQKDGWRNMQPKSAIITVETAAIRFCSDSSTPTTTAAGAFGEFANVGDVIKLDSTQEIINFRAINAVASSGSAIRVTYFY
jgi:hypothetical protein